MLYYYVRPEPNAGAENLFTTRFYFFTTTYQHVTTKSTPNTYRIAHIAQLEPAQIVSRVESLIISRPEADPSE